MKLKLQLLKDNEVLFEIPLSSTDWPKKQLENELESFEEDIEGYSKIFDALSHETRLRMMKRLVEESDGSVGFVDFMRDLELNPKIVWANTRKLREGGLLEKSSRGQYRSSDFGQASFMMTLVLKHLIETLEDFQE